MQKSSIFAHEAVDWLIANPPTDEEIKQRLTEIAVQEIDGL